jgi:hypothetical protein
MLNIISYSTENYSITDDDCNPIPVFETRGCACCSKAVRVTEESIAQAISEAEEWLETLRKLVPVDYSTASD